jgi:hypothetical protein
LAAYPTTPSAATAERACGRGKIASLAMHLVMAQKKI